MSQLTKKQSILYNLILPNKPGNFYLEKWGVDCQVTLQQNTVKFIFEVSSQTFAKVVTFFNAKFNNLEIITKREDTKHIIMIDVNDLQQFNKDTIYIAGQTYPVIKYIGQNSLVIAYDDIMCHSNFIDQIKVHFGDNTKVIIDGREYHKDNYYQIHIIKD